MKTLKELKAEYLAACDAYFALFAEREAAYFAMRAACDGAYVALYAECESAREACAAAREACKAKFKEVENENIG